MTEPEPPKGRTGPLRSECLNDPSPGGIYDYLLGGRDHLPPDRVAAERLAELDPAPRLARSNRDFLIRAVHHLAAERNVRQFIDIGTGLPTSHNVHEVVRAVHPDARVIYSDNHPRCVVHGQNITATDAQTVMVEADLRRPETLIHDPEVRRLLDWDRPIAVVAVAVCHFVPDADDPAGKLAWIGDEIAEGEREGWLVIAHVTPGGMTEGRLTKATDLYTNIGGAYPRDRAELERWCTRLGLDLEEPGLVSVGAWRPSQRLPQYAQPLDSATPNAHGLDCLGAVGRFRRPSTGPPAP